MHPLILPALLSLSFLPWPGHKGPQVDDVRVEYGLYHESARDPFFQHSGDFRPNESLNLGVDIELFKGVHWDNIVMAVTDPGQYRSVAWNLRLYVSPVRGLEIGYHHVSRHLLDASSPYPFPVQDQFEIIWHFYQRREARSSIF